MMGVPPEEFNRVPNTGFDGDDAPTGYGFAQVTSPYVASTDRNGGGRVNAPGRTERTMENMNELLPFLAT